MFKTDDSAIKLAGEIYLFKNFASAEECSSIVASLETFSINGWSNETNYDETSEVIPHLQVVKGADVFELNRRLSNLVAPDFEPLPNSSLNRLLTGQSLQEHWDSPGEDAILPDDISDPYKTCHIVKYGAVVYLSDFGGGEIYYSEQGIEYKPEVGDLVIHSSFPDYRHGVREVTSGVRYVYSTFLIDKGRVELPSLAKEG